MFPIILLSKLGVANLGVANRHSAVAKRLLAMGALPRRAASLLLLIRCAAAIPTLNQPLNDRQYWRGSSLESVTPSTSAAAARHRGHHADKPELRRRRRDPTWLALRGGAVDATAASATSGAAATKKKKKKKKKVKAKKQATPSAAAAAADAGGGAAARAAAPYKIDPTGTPLAAKAARLASVPLLVRLQARYAEVVARNAMLPLYLQLGSTLLFSKVGAQRAVRAPPMWHARSHPLRPRSLVG